MIPERCLDRKAFSARLKVSKIDLTLSGSAWISAFGRISVAADALPFNSPARRIAIRPRRTDTLNLHLLFRIPFRPDDSDPGSFAPGSFLSHLRKNLNGRVFPYLSNSRLISY